MTKRIVAKVGSYEKDGETKGVYTNIGVIMENDNGEFVLLEPAVSLAGILMQQRIMNPGKTGNKVMCSVFGDEKREKKPEVSDDEIDSIPF